MLSQSSELIINNVNLITIKQLNCGIYYLISILFFSKYKSKPEFLFADLTSTKEVEKLAASVKNIYPKGVDILVNNAGRTCCF